MHEAESRLIDRYYEELWLWIICFGVAIILTVIVFCLMLGTVLKSQKNNHFLRTLFVFVAVLLVVSVGAGAAGTMVHLKMKDYDFVKNRKFAIVQGEVVGFAYHTSSSDGIVFHKAGPIVEDAEGQQIQLNLLHGQERVHINFEYVFVYLPNTKMAEIVEMHG